MNPRTIPILPSRSFDATVDFFSALGFTAEARYEGEYLVLNYEIGIELHFWSHPSLDPMHNDASCYVRFETSGEAQALYEEWARSGIDSDHLREPEDAGYNLLEFALLDGDRNLIRVGGFIDRPA